MIWIALYLLLCSYCLAVPVVMRGDPNKPVRQYLIAAIAVALVAPFAFAWGFVQGWKEKSRQ